jgi:hypothetical protein
MVGELIELSTDETANEIAGTPGELKEKGSVTIEGDGINLKGYTKVQGVYQENDPPPVIPIPGAAESE